LPFTPESPKQYNENVMNFPPLHSYIASAGRIVALSVLLFLSVGLEFNLSAATSLSLAPADEGLEKTVVINIRSREFSPNSVSLTMGQKTRLVLKNLDSELHAFLPVGLLADSHLNVSGNGAPEFGSEGLVRVLLPTRGQTEIVFIPSRPGTYPYFCDLPGHVMQGMIVVHQKPGMVE
jgi:plastocyanin